MFFHNTLEKTFTYINYCEARTQARKKRPPAYCQRSNGGRFQPIVALGGLFCDKSIWLVVFYPSWKILVNGKDYPIYDGK